MLVANDIKTYSTFRLLDAEDVHTLEQIGSNGTTVKLRSHHAKRVSNVCEYISYLELSGKVAVLDDPSTLDTGNFRVRKHKGKPTSNVIPTPVGNATALTATEKLQKIDDDKLQSWRRGKARKDNYPLLESDEYFTVRFPSRNRI